MFFLSFSLTLLLLLYLPLPRDLQDLIKKINVASFFACPPECNFVTQRAPIYLQSIRHGRSKYSINTRLVSSLLNLFVSRRTPLHHNSRTASPIPSYFCGRRVRPLARSLAKDFIASFVQYHFTIVFPATSSAVFPFFDPLLPPQSLRFCNQLADTHFAFYSDDINAGLTSSRYEFCNVDNALLSFFFSFLTPRCARNPPRPEVFFQSARGERRRKIAARLDPNSRPSRRFGGIARRHLYYQVRSHVVMMSSRPSCISLVNSKIISKL